MCRGCIDDGDLHRSVLGVELVVSTDSLAPVASAPTPPSGADTGSAGEFGSGQRRMNSVDSSARARLVSTRRFRTRTRRVLDRCILETVSPVRVHRPDIKRDPRTSAHKVYDGISNPRPAGVDLAFADPGSALARCVTPPFPRRASIGRVRYPTRPVARAAIGPARIRFCDVDAPDPDSAVQFRVVTAGGHRHSSIWTPSVRRAHVASPRPSPPMGAAT